MNTPVLSPTLAANERAQARIARGDPIIHLAFGEAGVPVHRLLAEQLAAGASVNSYGAAAGDPALRPSVAGYLSRRGLETEPDQVVITPGSKAALFALCLAVPGDVVVGQPCWVSYGPQARIAGKRVIQVPIPDEAGGVPDPQLLSQALRQARQAGAQPGMIIVTNPDNPTGTVSTPELVDAVGEVAEHHGLVVVTDEIYRDLAYDPAGLTSFANRFPDNTVVTGGLSKAQALGGWRIGLMRAPAGDFGRQLVARVTALGSEIWSCLPRPMEGAARLAFDEPPELQQFVADCRRLHEAVATEIHRRLEAVGVRCRRPQAAFYLYPDLEAGRDRLATRGISTAQQLADALLEDHDIAVLSGEAFGDDPRALRFRIATSLLYGRTDAERWEALEAAAQGRVLGLARVNGAIERIAAAFTDLLG